MNNPNSKELVNQLRKLADSLEDDHLDRVASQFECDGEVLRQFSWDLNEAAGGQWNLWVQSSPATPNGEKAVRLLEQCKKATGVEMHAGERWLREDLSSSHFYLGSGSLGFHYCDPSQLHEILSKFGPFNICNIEDATSEMRMAREACDQASAKWDPLLDTLGVEREYNAEELRAQLREARGLLRTYMILDDGAYERYIAGEHWRTLIELDKKFDKKDKE